MSRNFEVSEAYNSCTARTLGPIGCLETSVTNYQSALCNILEERRAKISSDVSFPFTVEFDLHSTLLSKVNFLGYKYNNSWRLCLELRLAM
jgi:hypothetical protein